VSNPLVAILMGSDSDLPTVKEAFDMLRGLGIGCEVRVLSAHRCPVELVVYVEQAEAKGVRVFIAAAGGAAHLAGVVAAHTTRPVIGIPVMGSSLSGLDSLLSIVQMPGGVPVATMAIGAAGARNAGLFAAQILALSDQALADKLREERRRQTEKVLQKDERVRKELGATVT
jgi:5-(carboxyamino)imidazole ribonucleotide mutase